MGDFLATKKNGCDKLRRRLNNYRQHHSSAENRHHNARAGVYEEVKQETQHLKQRWFESKAKKAAKQSKTNRDNNSTTQNEHRNNLVVTKLKKKIDSVTSEPNSTSAPSATTTTTNTETVFSFDDQDANNGPSGNSNNNSSNNNNNNNSSNNKNNNGSFPGTNKSGGLPSVSVQIVQQISAHPQQDASQTIHTNVTVSQRYGNSNSPSLGGASHSVHTSVQCKQEPAEDNNRPTANGSNNNNGNTPTSSTSPNCPTPDPDNHAVSDFIGDVEDIQKFLDALEKGAEIEPALQKELKAFDEIVKTKCHRDSSGNESASMYGPLSCGSPGYPPMGPGASLAHVYDGQQAAMTSHSIPVPTGIPELTGPAAETLKQMAAQHQHQHNPAYPVKHSDAFPEGMRNANFQAPYAQPFRPAPTNANSSFPYGSQPVSHLGEGSPSLTFGQTKPLSHFATDQTSPSSLQQLQNQVQSHFKPSPGATGHQMQITQTQQMQVSHGNHTMHMSQTQQLQMQPPSQNMAMSQQQMFGMGQPQMMSEQMKMQMVEKMRLEQQQQQQHQSPQQGRMPPQYMGRPPPEYKMHPNARTQASYPNPNPLQTMQNMVNQTATYGVKAEAGSGQGPGMIASGQMASGQMASGQMSALQQQQQQQQQQSLNPNMASAASHMGNMTHGSQSLRPGFHHQTSQQQQQQQSAPQQQQQQQQQHLQQPPPAYSSVESAAASRTQAGASSYTSAIMRNQRPPNVNVGPDGLNISQPRSHSDWPRPTAMGMGGHVMQYQHRPSPTGHYGPGPPGMASSNMAAMQTQQQQHQQQQHQQQQQQQQQQPSQQVHPSHPGQGRLSSGSQMLMHQSMQVSHLTMRSNAGYTMGGPSPTANVGSNPQPSAHSAVAVAPPPSFSPPTSASNTVDDFLNLFDTSLNSQPIFDSLPNNGPDEFSLFDDFLNGK